MADLDTSKLIQIYSHITDLETNLLSMKLMLKEIIDGVETKDIKETKEPITLKPISKDPEITKEDEDPEKKPPVEGRPALKVALIEVLTEYGSMTPAEARILAIRKYGYWSSQNLYNLLKKDVETFKREGNILSLIVHENEKKKIKEVKEEDEDVDSFLQKVEADKKRLNLR